MQQQTVEKAAFDYFNSGYNCAEAIFLAIVEAFTIDTVPIDPKIASAFCGGIGKTLQETCGALTGGVIALGHLYGRSRAGENFDKAWQLAAAFRKQFEQSFQVTHCHLILKNLGEQTNMMGCKHLTGMAAGMLYQIIADREKSDQQIPVEPATIEA